MKTKEPARKSHCNEKRAQKCKCPRKGKMERGGDFIGDDVGPTWTASTRRPGCDLGEPQVELWKCSACSFQNVPEASMCRVCNTKPTTDGIKSKSRQVSEELERLEQELGLKSILGYDNETTSKRTAKVSHGTACRDGTIAAEKLKKRECSADRFALYQQRFKCLPWNGTRLGVPVKDRADAAMEEQGSSKVRKGDRIRLYKYRTDSWYTGQCVKVDCDKVRGTRMHKIRFDMDGEEQWFALNNHRYERIEQTMKVQTR